MIVVTGGAGFIGSNLVRGLNARGREDVLVVDRLDAAKLPNLAGLGFLDFVDKDDFLARLPSLRGVEAILHQGACSDTTCSDGRYLLHNNTEYSQTLLAWALEQRLPFVYASSAAVYGGSSAFREERACERPLNLYAFSKLLFDQRVRRVLPSAPSPIVGLRYFNVYGPGEAHKGQMASMVFHWHRQLRDKGRLGLFVGSGGYADGEQRRDFISVDDVVAVNLWFLDRRDRSGIFNVGTGRAATWNELARAVIRTAGRGEIEYIPFPPGLEARYQSFTEADLGALRAAGYAAPFATVAEAVPRYLAALGLSSPALPRAESPTKTRKK